ncbi:MAG: hypothetical protein QY306_05830 [Anaerolineales bacterium]|nr:MAG: hypothetical protein QY306_05830 [Anaerolineales bacterium]
MILPIPTQIEVGSNVPRVIFFSQNLNYIPKFTRLTPNPQSAYDSYQNPFYNPATQLLNLDKITTCSSPISVSVVNNIRENLPVSVTSGAEISSSVKSAYGFNGVVNVGWIRGSEFEKYYEIETTLRLRIYKYNATTSKNIGSPIHSEDVIERIYYDEFGFSPVGETGEGSNEKRSRDVTSPR